jgi:hypothetical protein
MEYLAAKEQKRNEELCKEMAFDGIVRRGNGSGKWNGLSKRSLRSSDGDGECKGCLE